MKNKKVITLVIVVILIILGIIVFFPKNTAPNGENHGLNSEPLGETQTQLEQKATLAVKSGDGEPLVFDSAFEAEATVFDLLQKITDQNDLTLVTKQYDFGVLVEQIGDKINGTDDKYWLYYVNDEMPMVPADQYQLKPGDRIEFKFEESKF